jgi:hypothetical protein
MGKVVWRGKVTGVSHRHQIEDLQYHGEGGDKNERRSMSCFITYLTYRSSQSIKVTRETNQKKNCLKGTDGSCGSPERVERKKLNQGGKGNRTNFGSDPFPTDSSSRL